MKIQLHRILADGRSVRYRRKDGEEDVLELHLIVQNPPKLDKRPPKRGAEAPKE